MDPLKEILPLEENRNRIIAPACIFRPSVDLVRKIARAVLQYGQKNAEENYADFYLRFGMQLTDFWGF
jgi:hypothetical protein